MPIFCSEGGGDKLHGVMLPRVWQCSWPLLQEFQIS